VETLRVIAFDADRLDRCGTLSGKRGSITPAVRVCEWPPTKIYLDCEDFDDCDPVRIRIMWHYMLALLLIGQMVGAVHAHADPSSRLEALLKASDVSVRRLQPPSTAGGLQPMPLRDTGDGADSLFCLTFNKRETKRTLRERGHAYVCFNFLQNPSEAVGNVLDRKGRQRCLITGYFAQGETMDRDCLILAFCDQVYVAGACY
jgi:hypothetical protein